MEDASRATLRGVARLRREIGWPFVLLEGLIVVAIGIAILTQPESARTTIRQLLGAVLLLTSALGAYAALRAYRESEHDDWAVPARLFGGGIGMTAGALVAVEPFTASLSDSAARLLLALGLLVYGLIDLGAWIAARMAGSLHRGALLTGILNTALGVLLIIAVQTTIVRLQWFGILAVVGGLALIGYAFLLRKSGSDARD